MTQLDTLSPVLAILALLGLAAFAIFVYITPTLIAYRRETRNRFSLLWLNLLLGWAGITWIICLVWACRERSAEQREFLPISDTLERDQEQAQGEKPRPLIADAGARWRRSE